MPNKLGTSLYLYALKDELPSFIGEGSLVFTSAQLSETDKEAKLQKLRSLADQKGAVLIVDINKNSLKEFGCSSLKQLKEKLRADLLRLDDGFNEEEIIQAVKDIPICLNASTSSKDLVENVLKIRPDTLFLCNFYPRPETGMDDELFEQMTAHIPGENLAVFINGDQELRSPLYEELVTLEKHRGRPPYVNAADFMARGIGNILVGDPALSDSQQKLIETLLRGIVSIPASLSDPSLYGKPFKIRRDSNNILARLEKTRTGRSVRPFNMQPRQRGAVTMDNENYGRYAGEVMIALQDLPKDKRVNTVGFVQKEYLDLLEHSLNDKIIQFTEEVESVRFQKPERA